MLNSLVPFVHSKMLLNEYVTEHEYIHELDTFASLETLVLLM